MARKKSIASPMMAGAGKAMGKALSGAAYRAYKKLDPSSVVREGEIPTRMTAPKMSGKGAKGKAGRRSLRKLTSKQRALYLVKTRERKSKKMGR